MPTVNLTLTGQALSKVDDTNVTLTLGGTPLTALLKATSITVGWTGQLSVARGGTGLGALGTANQLLRVNALGTALEYFTPTYGSGTVTSVSVVSANGLAGTVANATTTPAITLSTSINSPVLAGNGTALIAATTTGSGSTVVLNTSPTFVTDISAPKIISSTASGGLLLCNNNGVTVASFGVGSAGSTNIALIGATAVTGTISGTSSLTLGTASTTVGSIVLNNATNANTITIQSGVTTASHTLTLPVANASGVLTNNGTGTLTWATASSGITVGTTTITSGTTLRIPYNLAGIYQEQANFTIGSVATGFLDVPVGYARAGAKFIVEDLTTLNSSLGTLAGAAMRVNTTLDAQQQGCIYIGQEAGRYLGSQYTGHNTVIGYKAFSNSGSVGVDNQDNTIIGYKTSSGWTSGNNSNVMVGAYIGTAAGSIIRQSTYVGANIATVYINSGAFGYGAQPTAANQFVIGNAAAAAGTGVFDNVYFNGVTFTSPAPIVLNAAGGSGSNVSGASFTISGGKGTGTGTGGSFVVKTSTTLGTGTTLQSLVSRLTISGGAVTTDASTATWADALDFVFGTTTGTKIGTATTQKLAFYNSTPVVQQTTAVATSTFVANTSGIVDDSATFGGYKISQIVKALQVYGLLA